MKLPSNVSGFKVVKVLTKYCGYTLQSRKGSHVSFSKKGEPLLTIVIHPQLKKGTLLAIIRKTNIDKNGFITMLKKV